ncbi:MAG: MipA/OmpV family protein [Pseudomonadota bacterium]
MLASAQLAAAEDAEHSQAPYTLTFGAIGFASTSPFASDRHELDTGLTPHFSFEMGRLSVDPTGAAYALFETRGLTAQALLAPRWVAADPADVTGLSALKRDTAIEAGGRVTYASNGLKISAEYLGDISDTHSGHEINASVGTEFVIGERVFLGLEAAVSWNDSALGTYRYGVRQSEATAALAAFEVDSNVTPSLGLQVGYQVTERATLLGGARVEFLPSEVTDSPIVQRDTILSTFLGVSYGF